MIDEGAIIRLPEEKYTISNERIPIPLDSIIHLSKKRYCFDEYFKFVLPPSGGSPIGLVDENDKNMMFPLTKE